MTSEIFHERIAKQKEDRNLVGLRLILDLYLYFSQKFSSKEAAEARMKEFVLSCFQNRINNRLQVLLKFCNLKVGEPQKYEGQALERIYLNCLDYVTNMNSKGQDVPKKHGVYVDYQPMVRAREMLQHFEYPVLSRDSQERLARELEEASCADDRGQNKDGVVDFDLLMLKAFNAISLSRRSNLDHYSAVFSSFDILG